MFPVEACDDPNATHGNHSNCYCMCAMVMGIVVRTLNFKFGKFYAWAIQVLKILIPILKILDTWTSS